MFPPTLVDRSNEIFADLEGHQGGLRFFSEEEATDICLFNGFTFTLFPFFNSTKEEVVNNINLYSVIDLIAIDYKEGTYLTVLDKDMNFIYHSQATYTEVDGIVSYFYGSSQRDKVFLKQEAKDGELYFILYEDSGGPNLLQMIVSHHFPTSIYKRNLKEWKNNLEKQRLKVQEGTYEMMVTLPAVADTDYYVLTTQKGLLRDNLTEVKLYHSKAATSGVITKMSSLFLTLQEPTWFSFRKYTKETLTDEIKSLEGTSLEEAKGALADMGYEEVGNLAAVANYLAFSFRKDEGAGEYLEVILNIDKYIQVVYVDYARYVVMKPDNLEGLNSHKLKLFDDGLSLLNIRQQNTLLGSQNLVEDTESVKVSFDLVQV